MKKLIALLLALTMVAAMAAGCAPNEKTENGGEDDGGKQVEVPASALEILETVWNAYDPDEEKFFAMGGDTENYVDNAPGVFSVEDTDGLTYTLRVPAEQIENIDGAASLVHAMMPNHFTCGVFHMAQGADAEAFAKAMQSSVQAAQWMCGMPEQLIVAVVGGEYVLAAYGIADTIRPFKTHLTTVYPDAELVCDEAITG